MIGAFVSKLDEDNHSVEGIDEEGQQHEHKVEEEKQGSVLKPWAMAGLLMVFLGIVGAGIWKFKGEELVAHSVVKKTSMNASVNGSLKTSKTTKASSLVPRSRLFIKTSRDKMIVAAVSLLVLVLISAVIYNIYNREADPKVIDEPPKDNNGKVDEVDKDDEAVKDWHTGDLGLAALAAGSLVVLAVGGIVYKYKAPKNPGVVMPRNDFSKGNYSEEENTKKRTVFINSLDGQAISPEACSGKASPLEASKFIIDLRKMSIDGLDLKKPPPELNKETIKKKLKGAIMGLVIGDAYCSAFTVPSARIVSSPDPDQKKYSKPIVGTLPGSYTHFTALSLCFMASLFDSGKYSYEDAFHKLESWNNIDTLYMSPYMNENSSVPSVKKALISKIDVNYRPSFSTIAITGAIPTSLFYIFEDDTEKALNVSASTGALLSGNQCSLDLSALLAYIIRGLVRSTLTKAQICAHDFPINALGWYWEKYPHGADSKVIRALQTDSNSPNSSSAIVDALQLFNIYADTEDGFMKGLINLSEKEVYETSAIGFIFGALMGAYLGEDAIRKTPLFNDTLRIDAIDWFLEAFWQKIIGESISDNPVISVTDGAPKVENLNPKTKFETRTINGEKVVLKESVNNCRC